MDGLARLEALTDFDAIARESRGARLWFDRDEKEWRAHVLHRGGVRFEAAAPTIWQAMAAIVSEVCDYPRSP